MKKRNLTLLQLIVVLLLTLALSLTIACTQKEPDIKGWDKDAYEFREKNGETFVIECPPNGTEYSVWGVGPYTDDSSVCTAAVHAGKITLEDGGIVEFKITGPQDGYEGSTNNGITTNSWGPYDGSFIFP